MLDPYIRRMRWQSWSYSLRSSGFSTEWCTLTSNNRVLPSALSSSITPEGRQYLNHLSQKASNIALEAEFLNSSEPSISWIKSHRSSCAAVGVGTWKLQLQQRRQFLCRIRWGLKELSFISNRQRRKEGTFCASELAGIEPTPPAPICPPWPLGHDRHGCLD